MIQQAVAEGYPAVGVWAMAPSPVNANVMGRVGLDWAPGVRGKSIAGEAVDTMLRTATARLFGAAAA